MEQSPPTVAVVDDESAIRKALGRLLRAAGFSVETYPSGAQFLDALPGHCPACVLLDIRMPGMTGFEVQERLASGHIALPLIFITGGDDPGDRSRALLGGAVALLRKPFGEKELLAAVATAVGSTPSPAGDS
jgi:two-component system response regulator FixJ